MKFFKSISNKYEGVNVIGKAVYLCSLKRVKLSIITIFQGMGDYRFIAALKMPRIGYSITPCLDSASSTPSAVFFQVRCSTDFAARCPICLTSAWLS